MVCGLSENGFTSFPCHTTRPLKHSFHYAENGGVSADHETGRALLWCEPPSHDDSCGGYAHRWQGLEYSRVQSRVAVSVEIADPRSASASRHSPCQACSAAR